MRGDSDKERVELKGQTRHTHLDMDGMEIDAEPETLVACGEVDEGIAGEAPRPMDPIMTAMVILWRIEGILKEEDTHMRDRDKTSCWKLTDARPSLATLKQARQVLLTRITRCSLDVS